MARKYVTSRTRSEFFEINQEGQAHQKLHTLFRRITVCDCKYNSFH